MAHGGYDLKKSRVLSGKGGSGKREKMETMMQEVGISKKSLANMD